jgi:hypothetical protein
MAPTSAASDGDESLKRLGGGRWQTRDERFTIEPQSGTWAVVDAAETDDLGLPLVRGPFRSLTDAKAAIAVARTSETPASPLADRLERGRAGPKAETKDESPKKRAGRPTKAPPRKPDAKASGSTDAAPTGSRARNAPSAAVEPPAEPSWFRDLDPAARGRARRLIDRLAADGVADAESIVRRDLAGGVPALAAHAIATRLAELPDDASPGHVAELLAEGRDDALGVRWRVVDGDGRPIVIERTAKARRR